MEVSKTTKYALIASLAVLLLLNFSVSAFAAVSGCVNLDNDFWSIYKINDHFQMTLFMVLATAFAFTGWVLHRKLKQVSAYLAKVMKTRIILAVILISGPIFVRGMFLFANAIWHWRFKLKTSSEINNTPYYALYFGFFYSLLDILPMGLQFLTIQMVVNYKNSQYTCILTQKSSSTLESNDKKRNTLLEDTEVDVFESFAYTE
jgi:hypothetical protein